MAIKVFVSAGTPADDTQMSFRDAIVNAIELAGFTLRLMSTKDWDYRNPLRGIRQAMDECEGAVVVAYPRYRIEVGTELRREGGGALNFAAFPTAWNQIEAAMAYEKGIPLLVVADTKLRREAMLDSANDIRPFWTDLDSAIGRSDKFLGYLRSWKQDVEQHAKVQPANKSVSLRELTTAQILGALPWYELVAVVSTFIGSLLAAASIGYRVGCGQWPFG
ncbi:MAG: hypothetical protein HYZ50_14115 [Deltaproteobacteria bacterium]|nr:hypothetical protein [Deltaproteobacteria bacterium]